MSRGLVFLIGTGPEDRASLTPRSARALAQCEIVWCEPGLATVARRHARPGTETIEVERLADGSAAFESLERAVREGKSVGRLLLGDPLRSPRGAKEAAALASRGIRSEAVVGEASEGRPLAGRRVLVTRPEGSFEGLVSRLEDLGAEVFVAPAIRIVPSVDPKSLEETVANLEGFDWVVFTSANGVEAVLRRLEAAGRDARAFGDARVAAVGPATAERLGAFGIRADLVPEVATTEGLGRALVATGEIAGRRVLLPRSAAAPADLARSLERAGARVTAVAAYDTVAAEPPPPALLERYRSGGFDAVTFASASSVRHFLDLFGRAILAGARDAPRVVTIGPVTSRAAREAGLSVDAEASPHTVEGLVEATVEAMRRDA